MLGDAVTSAGLPIAARPHFERTRLAPQQRWEPAQAKGPTGILVDVVDDPHAVAEPIGAAECDGLMDGRQPEPLAGVNGEAGVVASHVLERIEMPRRRVSGLRPGDGETDHALVSVTDCQL